MLKRAAPRAGNGCGDERPAGKTARWSFLVFRQAFQRATGFSGAEPVRRARQLQIVQAISDHGITARTWLE